MFPVPRAAMTWPSATTLSGCPGGTSGQRRVSPSCTRDAPGEMPSLASPAAGKLSPVPSRLPSARPAAVVMPTLSKAWLRDTGPPALALSAAGPAAAALLAAGPAASPALPSARATRAVNVFFDDRIARPSRPAARRNLRTCEPANLRGNVQL